MANRQLYGQNKPIQFIKYHYDNNAHNFTNPNPNIIYKPQKSQNQFPINTNYSGMMRNYTQLLTATVVRLIVHSQLLGIEDSQFVIALSYETLAATPKMATTAQKTTKLLLIRRV